MCARVKWIGRNAARWKEKELLDIQQCIFSVEQESIITISTGERYDKKMEYENTGEIAKPRNLAQ